MNAIIIQFFGSALFRYCGIGKTANGFGFWIGNCKIYWIGQKLRNKILVKGVSKSLLQLNKAIIHSLITTLFSLKKLYVGIIIMKKFKFENANKGNEKLQAAKAKVVKDQPSEKDRKREQLQKEMKMLQGKIVEKDEKVKQVQKLLNIDQFLRKQKEKTKEYALKLNEEYDRQKKERQAKLYKKYNRPQNNSQKLITSTSKNQIPLNIFSAIQQLKSTQTNITKWILDDHHHKLNELILDNSKAFLFSDQLREQEQKSLKQKEENGWKRMKEVCVNSTQIKYLPVQQVQNELQPSEYGQILMSALTLMPKQLSQYLYNQAKVEKEEYFLCRFYPGGQKKTVITDQRIEVHEYTHKYININSRHRNGCIFWSSLLEKTYKKLLYKQITPNLRETVQLIYGLDAEFIPFNNHITIKENFPKILTALISNDPKSKIAFINDRTNERFFPLANIQLLGEGMKKKKKQVQQQIKQQILYHLSNPYSGILKSDFVNKFTMTELFQKFNRLVVLRQYPQKWGGVRLKVQFLSNGPLSFTSTDWMKNNQYSFNASKAVEIRLAMRRCWGPTVEKDKLQEEKLIYGFILFKSSQGETQISSMKLQNLIVKCKSNDQNGCVFNKLFDKGTYILIPFSHYISQQYTQSFNLDILTERQDAITINKAKIYEYYYDNKQSSDEKVIQKLQSRVKYQKPKSQKISIPKLYHNQEKPINQKQIESLNLILNGSIKLSDFFIPGKLKPFLVSGQAKQQKKQVKQKKSEQVQQIQKYQRQQGLKIMLGYDALMDQQINHGEMMALINETSDQIDLANYELGEEGLMGVLQSLMSMPRISKLNLAGNNLNDASIIYLCYYLEKGNRNQLRELDITGNKVGKGGAKALKGLQATFGKLTIKGLSI